MQSEISQEKKDGGIEYKKTTTEYDNTGNVTEKNEQIDSDREAKTEYTYDKRGSSSIAEGAEWRTSSRKAKAALALPL